MALIGMYTYVDQMLDAAEKLKKAGHKITVFSPIPLGLEIDLALGEKKNYIKYITFVGAIIGFFAGVALQWGTAAAYVLPRGGKPIFAFTPTILLSYETTILLGVIFTLVSFAIFAKLPAMNNRFYDVEVAVDSFGLLVEGDIKAEEVTKLMKDHGAKEVKKVEV